MQSLALEVHLQEVVFEEILNFGREVLDKTEPGLTRDQLENKLNDLSERWDVVSGKTTEREEQLDELIPLAQKYEDSIQEILPQMNEIEQIVSDCEKVPCERHVLVREQELIKVLSGMISLFRAFS